MGWLPSSCKESSTCPLKTQTVTAEEFIRRFLQHVLPERFVKVRYYGIWSLNKRHLLNKAKELLEGTVTEQEVPEDKESSDVKNEAKPFCYPKCGSVLVLVENLQPKKRRPP
ncbi:hypothetical protein AUJ95_02830 [Candidatus Desantisbacteria bacterium CG2_30_40_21]|uniref:Transposase IS801/IS1294 domain-containing protein n=1 Tax=Candidatus Desantisbacteria bacterium CG2_30_40_21 TaxID=1817895 RepID=A0A1J5EAA7_9BACT|nr:MAG: hypothetical protein AUJ95_02830 [Candidatus Desantisbacteria bacterium CG2_30_40_21]